MNATTARAIARLIDLQSQYAAAVADISRTKIPSPVGLVFITQSKDCAATVDLPEGALRFYPLVLRHVLMGDKLRAYYDCYLPGTEKPVSVRYDGTQAQAQKEFLKIYKNENIAAWNLRQIDAGYQFISLLPAQGRYGVSPSVIDAFSQSPQEFERALDGWKIPELS